MCTGYNTARKPNSAGYEKTFATGPPAAPAVAKKMKRRRLPNASPAGANAEDHRGGVTVANKTETNVAVGNAPRLGGATFSDSATIAVASVRATHIRPTSTSGRPAGAEDEGGFKVDKDGDDEADVDAQSADVPVSVSSAVSSRHPPASSSSSSVEIQSAAPPPTSSTTAPAFPPGSGAPPNHDTIGKYASAKKLSAVMPAASAPGETPRVFATAT